jgi:hypothetical protein
MHSLLSSSWAQHSLCACWHLKAVKGSSSRPVAVFSSHRVSRLISVSVWAQLTLLVPTFGAGPSLPQNGAPIHRVRAHSLSRVHDKYVWSDCFLFFFVSRTVFVPLLGFPICFCIMNKILSYHCIISWYPSVCYVNFFTVGQSEGFSIVNSFFRGTNLQTVTF